MSSSLRVMGWLTGAVVCLPVASRVQLFPGVGNGRPHNALRYHYHISQSAATSEIVKRFRSRI